MNHPKVGDIIEGTVVRVYPKYAIMLFDGGETGLLHISEISNSFVRNFTAYVQVGNIYKVKVISFEEEKNFMKISLKALTAKEKSLPMDKRPIDPSSIDFRKLEENLPEWIKKENEAL
jgi:S1 RNA binding domain protein